MGNPWLDEFGLAAAMADFVVDKADGTLSGASQGTVNVQDRIDPVDVSGT
jgi:hypothetical protein